MKDSIVFEFKLLLSGGILMITGAELYQIPGTIGAIGFLTLSLGVLMVLGGFLDRYRSAYPNVWYWLYGFGYEINSPNYTRAENPVCKSMANPPRFPHLIMTPRSAFA